MKKLIDRIFGLKKPAVKPPLYSNRAAAIDVLARTIYGEARGQPIHGMKVVLNRVAVAHKSRTGRYWWGNTVERVCLAPKQFSCWNKNDPNLPIITRVVAERSSDFRECLAIAELAVDGRLLDPTGGATHYHTHAVSPFWKDKLNKTVTIGDHVFYK